MPDNELVFEKVDENEIHKYPDSNEKIILKLNDIHKAIVDYENMKEEWYDNCNFSSKRKFEKKLYNKLLHNPSTFPEVNHLLASATVRLANESQCESIGSVVGRHYEHRGTLRAEKITKEVFIAWNGPLPFSQSNTLLRDALCLRFGEGPDKWHFLRVTKRTDLLQAYLFHSKVVYIHNSYDFPDDNAETKTVGARLEAFLSVSPESTYSTPAVYNLPLDDRECYFPKEGQTSVMSRYSYINCMAECRSKIIYDLCGCIPYQYPNNGTIKTCGIAAITCVVKYKALYSGALPGVNSTSATLEDSPCKCLPDCELYQYPSEISSGRLNRNFSLNSMALFKDIQIDDQSIIHVFFIDLVSTRYRQDVYQNWLGVLASFGGLLGLLLGFSFVTGFELIYFFTIRPLFDRFGGKKNDEK
ncbi:Pickpocket protein 11 [Pseudolycoriella hygida]|uniref:Pickpocket protein 11 n=1 Tax=Pseudolycoriella hygida TaxID=35572 RepID=A0A9Q0SAI4_9DIPT|nr:Pickpocket protein 11 [Pseudolycoriella hygida]